MGKNSRLPQETAQSGEKTLTTMEVIIITGETESIKADSETTQHFPLHSPQSYLDLLRKSFSHILQIPFTDHVSAV